jgi:hypothetical protein
MDKVFANQIGKNLEVYVDDVVINSPDEEKMMEDIIEVFVQLRNVNKKLNPKKCSFGMEEWKFLGVIVTK